VRLRPFRDADWPELLALWIAAWSFARTDIDFRARAPWLADLFARSAEAGAEITVAEDAAGLAGFVLFDANRRWLEQIAVHPRAQGAGVARALISRAKTVCENGLALSVNADNFRALAFYAREGFVPEAEGVNPLSGLPILQLRWARPPQARTE
jgi:putative acetyltransferase